MNATDLAYSYGMFLNSGPYANLAVDAFNAITNSISSVTVLNSTAVMLTAIKPDPLFPILTFLYSMYPWHYYKQFTGTNVLMNTPILGGPGDSSYVPENYVPGSQTMTLVPNQYYFGWNSTFQPKLSSITIQFFTSESSLVNGLASGTVNAGVITPSDVASLNSSSVTIQPVTSTFQLVVYMNNTVYPWNVNTFRQAIMYLLPKQQINTQLYDGKAQLGNAAMIIPQAMSTYWPGSSTPTYDFNPTMATALLKQSGLTQNANGNWVTPNGTEVTINFAVDNSDPNELRAGQMIQTAMQNVGLLVNLKSTDPATIANDWTSLNYELLMWENSYSPTPYRYLRNPTATAGFSTGNATFLDLRTLAAHDTDPARSLDEEKTAVDYFIRSAIMTSILILPQYAAYDNKFTGWVPAINDVGYVNVFATSGQQVFHSWVLAQIGPAQASMTSTSMAQTSSSMEQTTTSGSSIDPFTLGGIVVVIILVVAAAIYMKRRKPKT